MPYIPKYERSKWEIHITSLESLIHNIPEDKIDGELNYLFTRLLHIAYSNSSESYARYDRAIGLLECVKQELYRRKIGPYEDRKIEENGDVEKPNKPKFNIRRRK